MGRSQKGARLSGQYREERRPKLSRSYLSLAFEFQFALTSHPCTKVLVPTHKATAATYGHEALQSSMPQYAEVAVPLHVSQTFTYRLPSSLLNIAQIGARIVVPFGRQIVTGYIVKLHGEP